MLGSKRCVASWAAYDKSVRRLDVFDAQHLIALEATRGDRLTATPLFERFTDCSQFGVLSQDGWRDFVHHQYLPVRLIVRTS